MSPARFRCAKLLYIFSFVKLVFHHSKSLPGLETTERMKMESEAVDLDVRKRERP